jgi:flavin reductase
MTVVEQIGPVDAKLFRSVMGRFATGVTVITAETDGVVRGMTANSFMSVSLAPPLCLVSIAVNAHMHKHLLVAGRFGVSILAEGQEQLSLHFAGRGREHLPVNFEHIANTPVLKHASAVIVALTQACHACGDHTLFVGRLVHLLDHGKEPLVYYAGKYGAFVPAPGQIDEPTIDFW